MNRDKLKALWNKFLCRCWYRQHDWKLVWVGVIAIGQKCRRCGREDKRRLKT